MIIKIQTRQIGLRLVYQLSTLLNQLFPRIVLQVKWKELGRDCYEGLNLKVSWLNVFIEKINTKMINGLLMYFDI